MIHLFVKGGGGNQPGPSAVQIVADTLSHLLSEYNTIAPFCRVDEASRIEASREAQGNGAVSWDTKAAARSSFAPWRYGAVRRSVGRREVKARQRKRRQHGRGGVDTAGLGRGREW